MPEKNIQQARYVPISESNGLPYSAQSAPRDQIRRQSSRVKLFKKTRSFSVFMKRKIHLFARKNRSVDLNIKQLNDLNEPRLLSIRQIEDYEFPYSVQNARLSITTESDARSRQPSGYSLFQKLTTKAHEEEITESEKAKNILSLEEELKFVTDACRQREIRSELSVLLGSLNNKISIDRLYARTIDKQRKTFNREAILHCLDRLAACVKLQQRAEENKNILASSNDKLEEIFKELETIYNLLNVNKESPLNESELTRLEAMLQKIEGRMNSKSLNSLIRTFLNETHLLIRHFKQYELPCLGDIVNNKKNEIKKTLYKNDCDKKKFYFVYQEADHEKILSKNELLFKAFEAVVKKSNTFGKSLIDYLPILERFELGVEDPSSPENHSFSREGVVQLLDRLQTFFYIQQCGNYSKSFQDNQKKIILKLNRLKRLINEGNKESSLLNFKEVAMLVVVFKKFYKRQENNETRALLKGLYLEFMAGWADMARNEGYQQLIKEYDYLSKIGSGRVTYINVGLSGGFNVDTARAVVGVGLNKADILSLDEQGLTFHANEKTIEASARVGISTGSKVFSLLKWIQVKLDLKFSSSMHGNIDIKIPDSKGKNCKKSLVNKHIDIISRFTERKDMADELYHDGYKKYANRLYYWFSPEATLGSKKSYFSSVRSSVIYHDEHIQRAINNKHNLREQLAKLLHIAAHNKQEVLKSLLAEELNLTFVGSHPALEVPGKGAVTMLNTNVDYEQPFHAVYKKTSGSISGDISLASGSFKFANYDAQQLIFKDVWEKISNQYSSIEKLSGSAPDVADSLLGSTSNSSRKKIFNCTEKKYMIANQILEEAKRYLLMVDRFKDPLVTVKEKDTLELAIYNMEQRWFASYNYDLHDALIDSQGEVNHAFVNLKSIANKLKHELRLGLAGDEHLVNTLKTMIFAYKINIDSLNEQDRNNPDFKLLSKEFNALLKNRSDKTTNRLMHDHLSAFYKDVEKLQHVLSENTNLFSISDMSGRLQLNKAKENLEHMIQEDNKESDTLSFIGNAYNALIELNNSYMHYSNLVKQRDSGKHVAETQEILNRIQEEFLLNQSVTFKNQVPDTISAMVLANAEIGLRLLKICEDDPLLNNNPAYRRAKDQVEKNAALFSKPTVAVNRKYFQLKSQYALSAGATIQDKEAAIEIKDPLGLVAATGSIKFRKRPEHPNPFRQGELLSVNLGLKFSPGWLGGDGIKNYIKNLILFNMDKVASNMENVSSDSTSIKTFESSVNDVLGNINTSMDFGVESNVTLNFESIKPSLYEDDAFVAGKKLAVIYALEQGWIQGDLEALLAQHAQPKREWAYFRIKMTDEGSLAANISGAVNPTVKKGVKNVRVIHEKLFAQSLAYVVRDLAHAIAQYKGEEQTQQINNRIDKFNHDKDDKNTENDFDGNPFGDVKDDYKNIFSAMHHPDCIDDDPSKKDLLSQSSEIWYEIFGYLNLIETELKDDLRKNLDAIYKRIQDHFSMNAPLISPLKKVSNDQSISDFRIIIEDWLNKNPSIKNYSNMNHLPMTLSSIQSYEKLCLAFHEFWKEPFDKHNIVDIQKAKDLLVNLARLMRPILSKKAETFLEPIADESFPLTHSDVDSQCDPNSIPRIYYQKDALRV